jgi:cyclopropane-fatty-acyl-phospholipid synthase
VSCCDSANGAWQRGARNEQSRVHDLIAIEVEETMPDEPFVARARRAVTNTVLEPVAGRAIDAAMRAGVTRLADSVRAMGGTPLDIELPNGSRVSFGAAPRVVLRIKDAVTLAQLAQPTLDVLGTAFAEGRIDVDGDMMDAVRAGEALARAAGNSTDRRGEPPGTVHRAEQDAADIAFHYDVGNDFYRLWLDARWVYSCAYFRRPDDSLDDAQAAKLDHVCRKLRLAPGERFLDIGCGWGALVLHAARRYGVKATGITLSRRQFDRARDRIAEEGLADRAEVLLLDYRELPARYGAASFDKVASIGMFEHVGLKQLPAYFGAVATLLRDRGLFLNHGITSADVDSRPVGGGAGDFVEKYVFPRGELPHVSLALREMSAAGFEVSDIESLRAHYALTCEHWSRRLNAALDEACRATSDKTVRIWRAYLAGCAVGFQQGWMNIYQLLGSRQIAAGATALPLTREWMYREWPGTVDS